MDNTLAPLNEEQVRKEFPILERRLPNGKSLIYLDSAATSQKPRSVIQAMQQYYQENNANIHRGVHTLAEEATGMYEAARETVARFINAQAAAEVVFTRNTTESINLVARTWVKHNLKPGDLVILTEMEHHSNLVPWQMLAAEIGIRLEFIPVTGSGHLDMDEYQCLLEMGPKFVSFTHMSNVLGTINPAAEIIAKAHQAGAKTLLDGAQSIPHLPVDVQALDADFLAFSAHKMLGPTGIGILYGKQVLLEEMPPYLGGGDMIREVKLRSFTTNTVPHKFEAGTPAIAEAVGLNAAVSYLAGLGMDRIRSHEVKIMQYAYSQLCNLPGLAVFGKETVARGAVLAFTLEGIHPHDIAQLLDRDGIAVRAGHHCAMPLHARFNLPATTRASFYCYNQLEEVDALVASLQHVQEIFR